MTTKWTVQDYLHFNLDVNWQASTLQKKLPLNLPAACNR